MNWLIIIALIVLAFVFLRFRHIKHKVFLIGFIILLLFIYTTSSRVLAEHNIDWKSVGGIEKALKVYFSWIGGAFGNLKVITSNAIKMDWAAKNKTDESARLIEEKRK